MKTAHSTANGARHADGGLQTLLADVEELLGRISHLGDADTADVRKRVGDSLAGTRTWLQTSAARVRQQATDAAGSVNDYAHQSPWPVAGLATLMGLALGVMIARR